jgi:hypothetical protein
MTGSLAADALCFSHCVFRATCNAVKVCATSDRSVQARLTLVAQTARCVEQCWTLLCLLWPLQVMFESSQAQQKAMQYDRQHPGEIPGTVCWS